MSPVSDEGFIEHLRVEQTKAYLDRGRPFEHSTTEQLRVGWIQNLRAFIAGDYSAARQFEDIEAEFRLRGLEPPESEAAPEIEALARQVRETAHEAIPEGVQQAVADFLEARRKAH